MANAPDPVGTPELHTILHEQHAQVPEDVVIWEWPKGTAITKDRKVVCNAHQNGQHCCLDFFYDAIDTLLL